MKKWRVPSLFPDFWGFSDISRRFGLFPDHSKVFPSVFGALRSGKGSEKSDKSWRTFFVSSKNEMSGIVWNAFWSKFRVNRSRFRGVNGHSKFRRRRFAKFVGVRKVLRIAITDGRTEYIGPSVDSDLVFRANTFVIAILNTFLPHPHKFGETTTTKLLMAV